MLRLLSDQNFNNRIVEGLLKRAPDLDLVSVRDVGLHQAKDPTILAWAASVGRVLLTHDRRTIPDHTYDRVRAGESVPGIVVVSDHLSIGDAIEQILMIAVCCPAQEIKDQVLFVPL